MKALISKGMSVKDAWKNVGDSSENIARAKNTKGEKGMDFTGSMECCGFCDLGNVYKILYDENVRFQTGHFAVASSRWDWRAADIPLSQIAGAFRDYEYDCATGWIVIPAES